MVASALSAVHRRLAREERGFTIIEMMVAVAILTGGMLALATTFDNSRDLASGAERHDVASAMAQKEIERITALPWAQVALTSAPSASSDPADPTYYVSGGPCGGSGVPVSSPCYQWDWSDNTRIEPLAIDSTNGDTTANPSSWTTIAPSGGTRLSGSLYRFITWVKDPNCTASGCGGANDYKRVTVGVTVGGMKKPVVVSTLVRNSAGGLRNPLADPTTTCFDGASQVPCAQ